MGYFWQEQALHLLFVLAKIYLMFLDGVQMSIGSKTWNVVWWQKRII